MKQCSNCGSTTTYIQVRKNERKNEHWYYHNGKIYCQKCRDRLFKDPKWNPIHSKKYNPINNPKRIVFKDKRILLKENPRKGKCKKCGKKIGEGIKRTHMHHKKYDAKNPLAHTKELCISCHAKLHHDVRRNKK